MVYNILNVYLFKLLKLIFRFPLCGFAEKVLEDAEDIEAFCEPLNPFVLSLTSDPFRVWLFTTEPFDLDLTAVEPLDCGSVLTEDSCV